MVASFPSAKHRSRCSTALKEERLFRRWDETIRAFADCVWPAVLCAKSLRRSVEVALSRPF
jgi:hypothetical protein